ncbi:sugar MFS transporter [Simiduia agarivorans]|uniref:Multiple antibiotic resistance (MarC)-like protein n=1 Tax=Simiduia agarivorans (strain DSM 21679 / JCM 13881 / BCRC 17597 / SA1) TaxID=1117647 RepID=K4KVW1_SIMAS|nr:sugar MFS transporter [Simiduia agarivorans]AFU98077.1 multiple antibiotic resistance (MarC)-like protein [Simiduia agarivorans SA1 = DSM 21679]
MSSTVAVSHSRSKTIEAMIIIGALFFMFGFVTWLNGSLIPFLKIVCELNEFQAMFVTFAFYIAYTLMALPSAWILRKTGYKKGMVYGLVVMTIGALLFIPAAISTEYFMFLVALAALGSGLTLLQTASNPYIVCIGPRESAAMRISIMGLVNKAAGIVVPAVFATWILTGMDQFDSTVLAALSESERTARLSELSGRLVTPYLYMTAALVILALFIHLSPLADLEEESGNDGAVDKFGILGFPQVILGAVALFVYVGVEVIAGDTIGMYGQGLGLSNFGSLTSYTMSFMVIGYALGVVLIPRFISQDRALLLSAILGALFTVGVMTASRESELLSEVLYGWINIKIFWFEFSIDPVPNTVLFLALLGLANAMVWPTVWPLALEGLGKYTGIGSALLIMGIAGGAIIPLVYGALAEGGSSQHAYWIMLPCYAFIFYYALWGHKLRSWGK